MAVRKSRSTTTRSRSHAIKNKMTKRQLTQYIQAHVEQEVEAAHRLSSRDVTKIVNATLEGLALAMERSVSPGGCGQFMFPSLFKVWTRKKPAIRKGTMVFSPAKGEKVPSKGRPASMRVKVGPLVRLRRAAAGEA